MADDTEIKQLIMRAATEGYAAVTDQIKALAQAKIKEGEAIRATQVLMENAEKAQLAYSRAYDRQTMLFDKASKAQIDYAKQLKITQATFEQGGITAEQYAKRVQLLGDYFKKAAEEAGAHGAAQGLNRVQMMESVHVVKSLVDQLVAGQSPMRAFAVEGGRIGQIFTEGTGSVGSQLKGFAGQVGGLVRSFGPLAAIIGTVGGAIITGVAAWWAYDEAIQKAKSSVAGIGAYAGLTAEQLVRLADQSAASAHISDAAARDMAGEFAVSGRIGADMIGQLILVSKDFAATTGVDIKKAGEDLAKAFADPAKGAEELNQRLGFLDGKTLHYIETLAKQNDLAQAQQALFDAMKPRLDDAASHVTALGWAWDVVAKSASNAFAAMGAAIDRGTRQPTTLEKLNDLQNRRNKIADFATDGGEPDWIDHLLGTDKSKADILAGYDAQIAALQRQLTAEKAISDEKQRQVEAGRFSIDADKITRSTIPGLEQYEKLINEQATLKKTLDDPLAAKGLTDLDKTKTSYEAITNAIRSMTDAQGRFISSEENRIALMKAEADLARDRKNPAAARADEERIAKLKLYGRSLTDAEISGQISAAGDKAYNRSEAGQRDGLPQIFTGFERGTKDIQAQSQDYGLSPAVLAEQKAVNDLTAAVTREMEAKKQYGAISTDVINKIQQEAQARATAVAANERAKQSYTDLMNQEKFLSDQGFSLFEGAIKGAKGFQQSLIGVIESLEKAVLQSILLGQGPLAGLFGTQAAVSGQVGGLFGSFFGNQTAAATPGVFSGLGTFFAGLFADGGTIGSNQWGIVGERGPEIVKGSSYVQPLSKVPTSTASSSNSGGGTNVVNHFYVQTPDAPSFARSEQQITGMLSRAVGRGSRGA